MGRTPLHYAVATGNVELVSLLLQWHANPSVTDKVSDGLVLTVEYIRQLKHHTLVNTRLGMSRWTSTPRSTSRLPSA
jgi:hypothetical protein